MSLMVTYSNLQPEKEVCLRQLNARDHRFAVLRNRNVSARDPRPVWCVKGKCAQLHSTCVECHCEPSGELRGFRRRAWHNQNEAAFLHNGRFPNVIGCIDCTRVKVIAPSQNEHEYVNRKAYHSINVQVSNFVVRTSRFSTGSFSGQGPSAMHGLFGRARFSLRSKQFHHYGMAAFWEMVGAC